MTLFRALALTMALTLLMQLPASLHAQDMMESEPITLGPLLLTGAFSRATLPDAPVAGRFF